MKKSVRNPATSTSARASGGLGQVRLIGGRWRGSKLPVADVPGLRPTSDRVRETLFNWLGPVLPGARVLDLFAGSGALGLEALSRGAASAVLGEREPALALCLLDATRRLPGGDAASVVQADALAWLPAQPRSSFDIAFVDPPFDDGLWGKVLPALLPLLSEAAWLYVEAPLLVPVALPAGWSLHREGRTREVRYALYRRVPATAAVATDTLANDPPHAGASPDEPSTE